MRVEKYLSEVIKYETNIKILKNELFDLRSRLTNISKELQVDIVQTTKRSDKLENCIIKIIELEDKIKAQVVEYEKKRNKIIFEILNLDNRNNSQILYLKYIKGFKIYEIAKKMNYSYRWTQTLLTNALKEFENKYFVN